MEQGTKVGLLGEAVTGHRDELLATFSSASPFRHLVIDGFFTDDFAQRLLDDFPAFDEKRAINEFGEVGNKSTCEDVRSLGSAYEEVDDLFRSNSFLDLIEAVTGVEAPIYDPEYFGGGTHENKGGQDLDPHVDFNFHPHTGLHRRLNLIVYLNPVWEESWGGAIELHSDPWSKDNRSSAFAPVFNRAILFETNEYSWHGFKRITPPDGRRDISRRSLTVYYYTRSRPAAEVAPIHTTFYVPRQVPERITTGRVLTDEDTAVLDDMIVRRDRFLQLYQRRELEFSDQIDRMREDMERLREKDASREQDGGSAQVPRAWDELGRRLFTSPAGERYLTRPIKEIRRRLRDFA
jgi:2OG-Fe(II) oxygenase superfamily